MIPRLRHLYSELLHTWKSGLRDHFFLAAAAFFILSVIFFALGMVYPPAFEKFWGMLSASMENAGDDAVECKSDVAGGILIDIVLAEGR